LEKGTYSKGQIVEAMKPGPNKWTLTRPGGVSSVTGHIEWSVFAWEENI